MWGVKEREEKVWQFPVLFPPFRKKGVGIADTISHCSSYCEKKKKGGRAKKAFFFREKVVLAIEHIFPALLRGGRVLLRTRESLPLLLLGRTDASNSRQKGGGGTGNQATHIVPTADRGFLGAPQWTVGRGPDTFINRVARLRFLCGAGLITLLLTCAF